MPDLASTSGTYMTDMLNDNISSADKSSHCLLDDMSLYMENLTDLYDGCDDGLPNHFQTDSGALACVGCGILGFPFMTLIQPTEKSIMELLSDNHHLVEDSSLNSVASLHSVVSRDLSVSELALAEDSQNQSLIKCNKYWNTSSKFMKPRIFCLEHAVQIVEMLQSKGGANVLITCHSDYPKIKTHARAVAEEIKSDFDYTEIAIDIASQENLALIDLAIDGEELDEYEDWTSKLGLNLRFCVNSMNKSPCEQVPLTLALGMQLYHKHPGLSINWHSQKTRSKRSNRLAQSKPNNIQIEKHDPLQIDGSIAKKKLIQYSRKKFKSKPSCFSAASAVRESHEKFKNASAVLSGDHYKCVSEDELNTDNFRSDCALSHGSASAAISSPMHHEIQNVEAPTSFRTVFRRHQDRNEVRRIPEEEMFRFSHQVPNHLLSGQEAHNAPIGCRELDPADLLQIETEANETAGERMLQNLVEQKCSNEDDKQKWESIFELIEAFVDKPPPVFVACTRRFVG
ncbi:hypothetical protein KIW84_075057 [Lathyrus oleraceus]|uniref:DUF3444 domain-containing protein n=1 Tax=Pisum sativum TaxID=3888 RepID=A0A9D4VVP1_PEA|nr:hypothetical protein KIW84_075057 [Pisum sativum]